MTSSCDVCVLGTFQVEVDGRMISNDSWRNRRAADVVKLLALEPRHALHREQLMDALWPDLPTEAAAGNLRKAVHYARRALGSPNALQGSGGVLELWAGANLSVDLDRFHREAADALDANDPTRCARAAALYRGDVLPRDRYESWAADARERARAQYVVLLKCAEEWDRVLELDPTDETAHRALMQRYLDRGERREAIRQFDRLRDALREHLGVAPDPATVALYERVLAQEGPEPPSLRERVARLLANALVAWGRRDLREANRLAHEARALAMAASLGHELGEASTLLALIAYAQGNWHEVFLAEFAESVRSDVALEMAVFEAHLCFQEFYLYGPEGHRRAEAFGRQLLQIAVRAGSPAGQALATLLLGEFALLSGELDDAERLLRDAIGCAEMARCVAAQSIALERLAQTLVLTGVREEAHELLARAWPLAKSSGIPSHLVVRLFGVQLLAADSVIDALGVVGQGERWMFDAARVCDPCSMMFRVEAARVCARAGELTRARSHLADAERITGLWQVGPWTAAVWEARAELRRAEGQSGQATALFLEAAEAFAELQRPVDESRCREAALLAGELPATP